MDKQKISVKKVLEYKDALSYIEDLAKSFRSGTIVLESGEEHVVMKPAPQVSIKVEAKTKKDKQKIAFELSWSEAASEDLKIGDKQPATVPAVQPEGGAPAVQTEARPPATKEPAKTPAMAEKAEAPAKTVSDVPAKAAAPKAAAKKPTAKKAAAKKTTAKKKTVKKAPAKPAGDK
ncbi:amphi-Trp domain-containing protein [uncultured Pseudodesulfovibrio sp.]|uniref:amphi-Trp domain-containing protein n=1 Tax=uncultured Pseudodesulfovibrio sp. TaxID=2035858 RepID=UPI0029C8B41F|nr:amphi-Trp domain-containing protein [uncultured Pseudodesulfovibrio sp.]